VKILLLSAYAAQSHRYWQKGLQEMFPDWQWCELNLPPRYFSWRVRGNPLYWSIAERDVLTRDYNVLLATSMVDLATLRGLVPSLAALPSALYFHENQFDYPQGNQQHSLLEAQMVSLYSALAADRLLFNSAYNRDSFLDGCDALLQRLPDRVPDGVVASLREKCAVLPVPLRQSDCATVEGLWPGEEVEGNERPLRILWSGRFEHDKGGEGLLQLLRQLEQRELNYELAVTGQQFRNSPAAFATIAQEFEARLVQFGYVESAADFRELQRGADVILSTALHEFQGLAVLQAVAAGCVPVVPDRLAYREIYAEQYRYQSCPDDPMKEVAAAVTLIAGLDQARRRDALKVPSVARFSIGALAPQYQRELDALHKPSG
jgi:glycosyltransferase involved in cell wall biosynthesis